MNLLLIQGRNEIRVKTFRPYFVGVGGNKEMSGEEADEGFSP